MPGRRSVDFRCYPRSIALLVILLAGSLGGSGMLLAADKAAKPAGKPATTQPGTGKPRAAAPASSLDDELLKDLDNELLEGVTDPPARPAGRGAAGEADDEAAGDGMSEEGVPAEAAAGGDSGSEEDPLMRIGRRMRSAEQLMERRKTAAQTEQLQTQIVKDLADLIQQLEEQAAQSQSSSQSKQSQSQQTAGREQVKQPQKGSGDPSGKASDRPAKESTERLGKNEVRPPDMDQMKGLMKDIWGQLPAHAREQMLQSPPERFLPKYELLLEKYYKRLAEQQKNKP